MIINSMNNINLGKYTICLSEFAQNNRLSNKIVLLKYSRGKQGGFARAWPVPHNFVKLPIKIDKEPVEI